MAYTPSPLHRATRGAKTGKAVVQKSGTVGEGEIALEMPIGSFMQSCRNKGIIFGVNDIDNLSSGTYYYYYVMLDNNSYPKLRLDKVVDGVESKVSETDLVSVIETLEVQNMETGTIAVYFTKDGYIKLMVEDMCFYNSKGNTITGSEYGIMIDNFSTDTNLDDNKDSTVGTNMPFQFVGMTTDADTDYVINSGSWAAKSAGVSGLKRHGFTSQTENSLAIRKDLADASETAFRFTFYDYQNIAVNDSESYKYGIVFGATVPGNANTYYGEGILYYVLYLDYTVGATANRDATMCISKLYVFYPYIWHIFVSKCIFLRKNITKIIDFGVL